MSKKNEVIDEVKKVESSIVEDATPKKEKKTLSKKQKGIIIAIVAVILIIALAVGGYFIYQNVRKIDLIATEKVVEYGETYEPNVADFVNESKVNDTYAINGEMPNETEKEYPAIGDYNFTISAKGKEDADVRVLVRDTVAPEFDETAPLEISTFKDVPITEDVLKNTFTVKDLSPVTLTIDDVDYATVGEYTTNVYATDDSGNVTNKEIKVIVNEPTLTIEQANISINVGETAQLNATVQGASQTITWTSSDTSVATVDANGVVTGIKKGTATITATANGVEKTVEISVTAQSNNSSSLGSSRPSNGGNGSSNGKSNNSSSGSSSSSSSSGNSGSSSGSGSSSSGSHTHSPSVGNIGKWFSSRSELVSYYNSVAEEWNDKWLSGEISNEEYYANCPSGYECWSCSYCGKWTGNFKYTPIN